MIPAANIVNHTKLFMEETSISTLQFVIDTKYPAVVFYFCQSLLLVFYYIESKEECHIFSIHCSCGQCMATLKIMLEELFMY